MKTRLLIAAAVVAAAIPAVIGLWGNASFSQEVPVRVPASGEVVPLEPSPTPTTLDDNGGEVPRDQRAEPGDDRDVQGGTTEPGDDDGGSGHDDGDYHGGSSGSGHGSDD